MSDISLMGEYIQLSDRLIQEASKEQIAECARLLALNVAHYQSKYGELPLNETLEAISSMNDDQAELVTNGMEILVGVLGSLMQGWANTEDVH